MTKFYEVRCTANAEITELWRVQANSADEAIDLIGEGQGDFIRQCDIDDETDRRNWHADEVSAFEYETLGQFDAMQAAAPDMLAALESLTMAADDFAEHGKERHWKALEKALADSRAAIAKAKGEGI